MSNTIFKPGNNIPKSFLPVTEFETEVLKLIRKEKNLEKIAKMLEVSIHTIQAYKISLLQKFQTKNLHQLEQVLQTTK